MKPEARPRHGWAATCAVLMPGGGHFVVGRWQRALTFVFLEGLAYYAGSLGTLLVWPGFIWIMFGAFFAIRTAANIDLRRNWPAPSTLPPLLTVLAALAALLVVGGLEAATIRGTLIEAFKIPSGSMIPTLEVGDHIFVDRRAWTPTRGDVIVFRLPKDPSKDFAKRVVALAGDTLEIRDQQLILNGTPVPHQKASGECGYQDFDENMRQWQQRRCQAWDESVDSRSWRVITERDQGGAVGPAGPWTIPAGHVFVLGDNRDNSHDSRYWGFLPLDHVKGRAVWVWVSFGSDGVRWNRVGTPVR